MRHPQQSSWPAADLLIWQTLMDAPAAASPLEIDLTAEAPFRVGRASVDPVSREARFDETNERIQPQNLKVLIALARGRGRVVTREQLVDQCWDGRFVGEDVINRAISTLRQFAERAEGFRIETVPRAGYRLVETKAGTQVGWRRVAVLAAVAAIATALLLWFLGARNNSPEPPAPTIALLPFSAATSDAGARQLAAATRDSLAHTFSQTQFRVTLLDSRSQSGNPPADFFITGEVRGDSGKFVATVRMEESAHQIIVYSHRFEANRRDAHLLADQIGGQVAGAIGWTVPFLMLDRKHPSDPAVTAQLFQEIDLDNVKVLKAYETSRRLARRYPNSALVQVYLAYNSAFALAELPREERAEAAAQGRVAADKARALAPEFGEPYVPWCLLHSRVQTGGCEDRLRAGMRADPDAPFVDWFLADRLKDVGRFREALELATQSLAHDPFVPTKIGLTLRMLDALGNTVEAEKLYQSGNQSWLNKTDIFYDRVSGMMDRGDLDAVVRFEDAVGRANWPNGYQSAAPLAAAVRSNSAEETRRACAEYDPLSLNAIMCVAALARVGDLDSAFAFAARIYPPRVGRTPQEEDRIWLDSPFVAGTEYIVSPSTAPLRRDQRYLELAQQVGLLSYWRNGRLPDFCRPPAEPVCSALKRH